MREMCLSLQLDVFVGARVCVKKKKGTNIPDMEQGAGARRRSKANKLLRVAN